MMRRQFLPLLLFLLILTACQQPQGDILNESKLPAVTTDLEQTSEEKTMVENDNADQTPLEDESITEIEQTPDIAEIEGYTPEQLVMQLEETLPCWSSLFQEPLDTTGAVPNEYITAGDSGAAYLAWYDDMEKPIIIRNTDDTATTLYTSHDLRPIRSILEWQDNLYFVLKRKDNRYYDLYRVPVSGGTPELLYEQLSSFTSSAPYCIIGKHAYLITATEQLLAISLDAPEEPVLLLDSKQRCEIISLFPADHGLVLQVKCAHKTGDIWCWLYLSAKGITLLDVIDEDDFMLQSFVGGNLGLYQKVRTDKTVDIYRVDTTTGSRGDLIVSFPSKSDLLIVVVSIIEETATIRTEGFDESGLRWEAFYALNLTTGEIRELLYYPYVGTHNMSPTRLFQIQQCGNDLYLLGYHQIYHITRYRDIYSGATPVEEGFDDQSQKWITLSEE